MSASLVVSVLRARCNALIDIRDNPGTSDIASRAADEGLTETKRQWAKALRFERVTDERELDPDDVRELRAEMRADR